MLIGLYSKSWIQQNNHPAVSKTLKHKLKLKRRASKDALGARGRSPSHDALIIYSIMQKKGVHSSSSRTP